VGGGHATARRSGGGAGQRGATLAPRADADHDRPHSDDPPSDKGKQKADVEMVDASDRPRTSAVPDGDSAEASAGWPDFAELALVQAKEELPR
jgi:hypothetical protein